MAIRRCPYCKAIIDEQDKYCNNCGTQLLFPEDEFVEEEIPGDRIVDKEETDGEGLRAKGDEEELEESDEAEKTQSGENEREEEDKETDEFEGKEDEDKDHEEDKDEEEDEDKDDSGELEEPDEEEDEDEDQEEESISEEEEEEEEDLGEDKDQLEMEAEGVLGEEDGDQDEEEIEEEAEEEEEEEIEEPVERLKAGEPAAKASPVDEPHKKYKVSIEKDELVFKTKDLENLTRTVEEGKEKLEEFLDSRREAKPLSVTPEEPGTATRELVPPWASGMKESPPSSAYVEEAAGKGTMDRAETTQAPTGPGWTTDSGIGIPEKVTQAGLPFGTAALPVADGEKREVTEEEEKEEHAEATAQRPGFSLKLKSKIVDLAFITALWLVTLWFTAQVIGVSFLQVVVGSPVPVLALLFILLLLYFFLFLYFLGETLGDHYFSEEE